MTLADAGFVSIGMTVIALIHGMLVRRQIRHDINRYRIFALRDELIGRVADSTLNEEDTLFQRYYQNVNALAAIQPNVNTWLFAQTVVTMFDPRGHEKQFREEERIIAESPPEVQETIKSIYIAVMEILASNSWSFRGVIRGNKLHRRAGQVILFIECLFCAVIYVVRTRKRAPLRDTAKRLPATVELLRTRSMQIDTRLAHATG